MAVPRSIRSLAAEMLTDSPLAQKLKDTEIWNIWPRVVGRTIADKAYPVRIVDGILTVGVASSPWLQELSYMKEQIREKLNEHLKENRIRDIRLKNGVRPPAEPDERKPPARLITEEERSSIESCTSAIDDPELRREFATLMEKHLAASAQQKR